MKKIILFTLIGLILVVSACSVGPVGRRSATISTDHQSDSINYTDSYVGFLMPTITPQDVAQAENMRANADLTRALAKQISQGRDGDLRDKYIGGVVNQDESRTLTLYHPSMNSQIQIPPGQHTFVFTNNIPEEFNLRWQGIDVLYQEEVVKKKKKFHGVNTDYGLRLWYNEE